MILYLNYINKKQCFSIKQDERYYDPKAHISKKIKSTLKIKKNHQKNLSKKKNSKKNYFFVKMKSYIFPDF